MDTDATTSDERENRIAWLFVLAVLGILAVPGLMLLRETEVPVAADEQRTLAKLPGWPTSGTEVRTLPTRFQMYVDDHFGFRNALLNTQHRLQFAVWGQPTLNPTPAANPLLNQAAAARISNDVLVGRHGWLFFKGDRVLDDARGLRPFSDEDLAAWTAAFEQNRRMLAERGIEYVVVFVPNKISVYPEHLPQGIHFEEAGRRLPQLISSLREVSEVEVLDQTQFLRGLKSEFPCYYQTDTHWNEPGAYYALHHLFQHLDIDPVSLPALRKLSLKELTTSGRDLARMIGLGTTLSETTLELSAEQFPRSRAIPLTEEAPSAGVCTQFRNSGGESGAGRVMLVHDSFGLEWYPWLAEECAELTCCWSFGIDFKRIEDAKPDLVIHQIVERMLPVRNPEELRSGN